MPKASDVKIELVRKYVLALTLVVLLVFIVVLGLVNFRSKSPVLRVGSYVYTLEVAKSAAAQEKGLGDRTSLPINHAMLFSFSNKAVRCFWMKDMHFPIDMIWLDSHKQVLHIEPRVSPSTYPETFCPSQPAEYVLEMAAGQSKAAKLTIGQTLNF